VIDKCDCLELKQKFSKIKKELQDEGHIHKKTSIEMLKPKGQSRIDNPKTLVT
jgi:hypothetical protein